MMEPSNAVGASTNFFPPPNPAVSTFYEVNGKRELYSDLVLAVWSCHHKLLCCNAVCDRINSLAFSLMQRFISIFERAPHTLARLTWPDLCGPTRNLPDQELASQIDESYDTASAVADYRRHEKLKVAHLSLRDGLTSACTVRPPSRVSG